MIVIEVIVIVMVIIVIIVEVIVVIVVVIEVMVIVVVIIEGMVCVFFFGMSFVNCECVIIEVDIVEFFSSDFGFFVRIYGDECEIVWVVGYFIYGDVYVCDGIELVES